MPGLQQFRQFALRCGERLLQCNGNECAGARRTWQRLSSGAGSVCVHGLRYCFPRCFERELLRRFGRMRTTRMSEHRPAHRVPLGLLMLSRAELTHSQLRHALEEQQRHAGRRIGECMQQLGYAREPQITAALALQWSCPTIKVLSPQIVDCGVPLQLLRQFQMAPVHFSGTTRSLHIAFVNGIEYPALVAIEQMLGCKTEACLISPCTLEGALARIELESAVAERVFPGLREPAEMTRIVSSYVARLGADEVRVVACGGLAWIRIEAGRDPMNLLFHLTN